MKIGGEAGYQILKWLGPRREARETRELSRPDPAASSYLPKIQRIVGIEGWQELRDKTVLDFGCGMGAGSIEMARQGARRVIGIDIREECLEIARRRAEEGGVSRSCEFRRCFD